MENPTPDDFADRVLAIVARSQRLPRERVALDSSFEDLGIDSLDGFSLIFELEEAFDLSIPDDAARGLETMKDLVEALRDALAERPGEPQPGAG